MNNGISKFGQTWRLDLKRWKRLSAWGFVVIATTLSLSIISGCSEDAVDVGPQCNPVVQTNTIILNPLTPAPGDTVTLTVQAAGEGCGNWGAYTWSVEGGELLQDKGITVQWKAPEEYGEYAVRCVATLSGTRPDTSNAMAMVRNIEYIETGKVASVGPRLISSTFFFIAEEGDVGPRSPDFLGWSVYSLSSTGHVTEITDTGDPADKGAYEFSFSGSGEAVFGSFITNYYQSLQNQRLNIWKFPTRFGASVKVSDDSGGDQVGRKNQHRYPSTNALGDKAVWKYRFAGPVPDGTRDLFNVAYWDEPAGEGGWYTLTVSHDSATAIIGVDTVMVHRYYQNIKPMFTPDESNILYFVDTTGVFEPCLIPMVDGQPDTLQRRALMIDGETGIFGQAGVEVNDNTIFQWMPSGNLLAFISSGHIVFFDYLSETVAVVDELRKVSEFAWSPDGSQLAAVNDDGVFLVSPGGVVNPSPVFVRELSTDLIKGINWNHDTANPRLAFRLTRKGKSSVDSWSSLIVVDIANGMWAYAARIVPWHSSREPANMDYTWMRTLFTDDDSGIYAPMPVMDDTDYPGKDIIIIYSHE